LVMDIPIIITWVGLIILGACAKIVVEGFA
jgi:hypothetical protein